MQFIDEAKIHVRAGDGGNGAAAFRREAHTPKGGPAGGDGGDGGSVIFIADGQLSTLLDFKYQQHYRAEKGEHGRNKDQYGKAGADLIVRVPVGTVVLDEESGATIADMTEEGQRAVVARGGHGGKGNIHFKTPWNQAPRQAEPGTPGQERTLRLHLKLLADAGLLGLPNAGKSTFLAAVSRARPKIAGYPFTTLTPHLGVVGLGEGRSFVLADIPGLIEGAADGAGLGHRFLRHVERTRVLVHLVTTPDDALTASDPADAILAAFDTINRELLAYDEALARRPQVVALNKVDLAEVRATYQAVKTRFAARGVTLHAVSGATGEGVRELLEELWKVVHARKGSQVATDPPIRG